MHWHLFSYQLPEVDIWIQARSNRNLSSESKNYNKRQLSPRHSLNSNKVLGIWMPIFVIIHAQSCFDYGLSAHDSPMLPKPLPTGFKPWTYDIRLSNVTPGVAILGRLINDHAWLTFRAKEDSDQLSRYQDADNMTHLGLVQCGGGGGDVGWCG